MKVKVAHLTYNVKGIDRGDANIAGIYGYTDHSTQTIGIEEGLSKERRKEILLHEILHAVYYHFLSSMNNDPDNPDKNLEEKIVTAMGRGLSSVFQNNQHLKKELF